MRSSTTLLSQSQKTAQLYAAGQSSNKEDAPHIHGKKASAMWGSGSPSSGRCRKQLANHHFDQVSCLVTYPTIQALKLHATLCSSELQSCSFSCWCCFANTSWNLGKQKLRHPFILYQLLHTHIIIIF